MSNIGNCPPVLSWLELDGEAEPFEVPFGGYKLGAATPHAPDHTPAGPRNQMRKGMHQSTICHHSSTQSSMVEHIGLVILENGQFGIYCKFQSGGEIVYVGWNRFEDAAGIYKMWKGWFSKGKFIHNMLWQQDYYEI